MLPEPATPTGCEIVDLWSAVLATPLREPDPEPVPRYPDLVRVRDPKPAIRPTCPVWDGMPAKHIFERKKKNGTPL